jgi:hypothetical protein
MKNLLKTFLILYSFEALAVGRLDFSYGYFSINAKTKDKSGSLSSPTAANLAYLYSITEKIALNVGYTILLADLAASDKGYGLNMGFNYYLFSSSKNEKLINDNIEVERYQLWRPYTGFGFYQRDFQSIKDSYAGFGLSLGTERYYNKDMSFKGEIRTIALSGSNEASAFEVNAFFGVLFNI